MKEYQSLKRVHAFKITNITRDPRFMILRGDAGEQIVKFPEWANKNRPHIGGYYVLYRDGHSRFIKAEAFEAGYMECWEDDR